MIYLLLFLLCLETQASEIQHTHAEQKKHLHGTHRECPLPKSTEDIINCAMEFHPSVQKSRYEIQSSQSLEEQAAQIPNPVINSRYVKGEDAGQVNSELEANIQFKLELGGKRNARINKAKSILASTNLSLKERQVQVKLETITALYRLKQLKQETKMVNQTLQAYRQVIKKLRNIPTLNSEQEASLTLFEVALEETKVLQSELFQEEKKLEHFFSCGHRKLTG